MKWEIVYLKEALQDLEKLDEGQRRPVLRAIEKVSTNPLPDNQGGYGKPLGNHNNVALAGCMKIKLLKLGIRVVYQLIRTQAEMRIIIIGVRKEEKVYTEANRRIAKQKAGQ